MNADGTGVKRITNRPGPDGGAFFSKDGKKIVWRGKELKDPKELAEYQALLKDGLWRPSDLEIFVADADGSNVQQVTNYGGSSFAPFFHPDGKRIIFSSNMKDPKGRNFDLFLVNLDGTGLEQVTFNGTFDGFPMWSPDGKQFVFASNRNNVGPDRHQHLHRGVGGQEVGCRHQPSACTATRLRPASEAHFMRNVSRSSAATDGVLAIELRTDLLEAEG